MLKVIWLPFISLMRGHQLGIILMGPRPSPQKEDWLTVEVSLHRAPLPLDLRRPKKPKGVKKKENFEGEKERSFRKVTLKIIRK